MLFLAYCRELLLSTTSFISVEAKAILQTAGETGDGNIDEPENPHSSSSTRSTSKH